ncbi:MAG: type II toxin-antitoxin system VapC family toxin [Gemmatimonadota bacterium]
MRYWDSSAIIPLLIAEESSSTMDRLLGDDPAVVTWWGSAVECTSALARLERDGSLTARDVRTATNRLSQAMLGWIEVPAGNHVRQHAIRLLRLHSLRAGDALQLAAAVVAADMQPATLEIVTLDERLVAAGEREGFTVRTV